MSDIRVIGGLAIRDEVPGYCCPYCKAPVGYVGRFFAWALGAGFHGCNFSNVMHPQEYADELLHRSQDKHEGQ